MISSLVSSIGTWMQTVALGVYLTETTHNAQWLGLLTLAAWLPALVGSPLGGVVADRWNRQRWIQINNAVMALTASGLAWAALAHDLHPLLACGLAVVEGLSGSSSWAASQSLLRDLVDPGEVLSAVSLSSAQFNLGRIFGPMAAGVILSIGPSTLCFELNAASFIFVVLMFAFVRTAPRPPVRTKVRVIKETVQGIRAAWRVPGCRNPIAGVGFVGFVISPFITLVPAMAIEVLHAGKVGTSWLVTAQGVGAVLGAMLLPALAARTSRLLVLQISLVGLVLFEALYALAPTLWLSVVALVLMGATYVGTMTGLNTSVQLHAPEQERSRILALYTLSLSVFYPVGALIQSNIAHFWGVRQVTWLAVAVAGLTVALALAWPRIFFTPMGQPVATGPVMLAD